MQLGRSLATLQFFESTTGAPAISQQPLLSPADTHHLLSTSKSHGPGLEQFPSVGQGCDRKGTRPDLCLESQLCNTVLQGEARDRREQPPEGARAFFEMNILERSTDKCPLGATNSRSLLIYSDPGYSVMSWQHP